jgi:hypothetical protein
MRPRVGLQTLMVLATLGAGQSPADAAQIVRCAGRVVKGEGRPVDGASVVAFEMLSDGLAGNIILKKAGEFTSGKDGTFAVAVPAKPARGTPFMEGYVVAAKEGLALGWAVWNMREDLTATLSLGEPGTVVGVVIDERGKPIGAAHVRANLLRVGKTARGDERKEWLPGLVRPDWLETRTDHEGRFTFSHLPGDARVHYLITAAGKATTYTDEPQQAAPARAPGNRPAATFILPREACLAGRILDPDTHQGVPHLRFAVVPSFSGLFYYRLVCTTDESGAFRVGGLKSGAYFIRGDALPGTDVVVQSGETSQVTIRANQAWYGRILFQNGEPAVVKPAPWPGAITSISLAEDNRTRDHIIAELDNEGYFQVWLSQEQYQKLQSGQGWFHVRLPEECDSVTKVQRMREETVLAVDVLARDKAKAGSARIAGPRRDPVSLVGRALPSLEQLGLGDVTRRTEDKTLLLCFMDIQQRPSRNCLQQLVAGARELETRGVVMASVQAARVDPAEFHQWITDNKIRFPVGRIPGAESEICFAWGVKSLPWLILVDRAKKVVAEGFSVQELDACLTRMKNP